MTAGLGRRYATSAPRQRDDWGWYGTGPGAGIQLASGRLVVPCYHTRPSRESNRAHSIYSDDHGVNWQRGEACGPHCGESAVAEAHDGSLVMLMRQHPERTGQRHLAISRDGGVTWTKPEKTLVDPGCQGSMIKVPAPDNGIRPWIAFANPASEKKTRTAHATVESRPGRGRGRVSCCSTRAPRPIQLEPARRRQHRLLVRTWRKKRVRNGELRTRAECATHAERKVSTLARVGGVLCQRTPELLLRGGER